VARRAVRLPADSRSHSLRAARWTLCSDAHTNKSPLCAYQSATSRFPGISPRSRLWQTRSPPQAVRSGSGSPVDTLYAAGVEPRINQAPAGPQSRPDNRAKGAHQPGLSPSSLMDLVPPPQHRPGRIDQSAVGSGGAAQARSGPGHRIGAAAVGGQPLRLTSGESPSV